jgi:hypothetical protein
MLRIIYYLSSLRVSKDYHMLTVDEIPDRALPVLTGTHQYLPVLTSIYRHLPVLTGTYRYLPVLTGTYQYLPVHTSTYQYIPAIPWMAVPNSSNLCQLSTFTIAKNLPSVHVTICTHHHLYTSPSVHVTSCTRHLLYTSPAVTPSDHKNRIKNRYFDFLHVTSNARQDLAIVLCLWTGERLK